LFMHSGNGTGPINEETAQLMSKFPIVTMAGFQGNHPYNATKHGCCNEDAIIPFSRSIKAYNNDTRVLFYQNTLINFPESGLNRTVPEELLLHDKRGRLVYLGGCGSTKSAPNHTIYDHANPVMRAMWSDNVVKVVQENKGFVDGVFCDRSGSIGDEFTKDLECYNFADGQLRAWNVGHWQAVADTQTKLDKVIDSAVVIGNHAMPTADMHLEANASRWNGKMFEHFVPSRPYIPPGNQLAAFEEAGEHGLISEAHVDFCKVNGTGASNVMFKRSLAAFLIGATEYSYYACTNGWGIHDGWEDWSPDYDRALGEPKGPAERTAHGSEIWRREFASGTVVYLKTSDETDSEWGSSCIRWSDGNVTKSGQLCNSNDGYL